MKITLRHPYGQGYADGRNDAAYAERLRAFAAIRGAIRAAIGSDKA